MKYCVEDGNDWNLQRSLHRQSHGECSPQPPSSTLPSAIVCTAFATPATMPRRSPPLPPPVSPPPVPTQHHKTRSRALHVIAVKSETQRCCHHHSLVPLLLLLVLLLPLVSSSPFSLTSTGMSPSTTTNTDAVLVPFRFSTTEDGEKEEEKEEKWGLRRKITSPNAFTIESLAIIVFRRSSPKGLYLSL